MAKSGKNISVRVTPGQNTRIDPVLRLEDLLQRMPPTPAPKAARGRAAAVADDAGAMRQLAAELEARLRALRTGKPPK
ncbi:hypothetical protein AACH10_23635 [Ideonella sp. DXS22W]|uniref:Uncharacterized protein n=1 Tax=Pseudaquabacterium inlustre TaxID=2984192 RepID=A0ABU9CNR8_9BURK